MCYPNLEALQGRGREEHLENDVWNNFLRFREVPDPKSKKQPSLEWAIVRVIRLTGRGLSGFSTK